MPVQVKRFGLRFPICPLSKSNVETRSVLGGATGVHPSAHRGEIVVVPAPKIKQLTVGALEDSTDCRRGSCLSRAPRADLPISMLLRWHSRQYEQGSRWLRERLSRRSGQRHTTEKQLPRY